MSVADRYYMQQDARIAAEVATAERLAFLRKTYVHLLGAVLVFCFLVAALLRLEFGRNIALWALGGGFNWLILLGGFMLASWVAEKWARSSTSIGMQYLGLGVFVVAEAIIFLPILLLAQHFGGPDSDIIPVAGASTVFIFGALSIVVFLSKKDFSFLGPALWIGGLGALAVILGGMIFGFHLGNVFTIFMIILASGWILYDTSKVLHHYRTNQHVAASLALFSSVALLFWYILQLVMSLSRE